METTRRFAGNRQSPMAPTSVTRHCRSQRSCSEGFIFIAPRFLERSHMEGDITIRSLDGYGKNVEIISCYCTDLNGIWQWVMFSCTLPLIKEIAYYDALPTSAFLRKSHSILIQFYLFGALNRLHFISMQFLLTLLKSLSRVQPTLRKN